MIKTGFNWGSANDCVRLLADVTGHGRCDIVGFGINGVWVAKSDGAGGFLPAQKVSDALSLYFGSWQVTEHPRLVSKLRPPQGLVSTAEARIAVGGAVGGALPPVRSPADLVGFGVSGVHIALNNGDGTFGPEQFVLENFGVKQSWSVRRDVRVMADLHGRGFDSIVGFGENGTWFAVNDGHANFSPPQFIENFGYAQGWRLGDHPRFAADLNMTGRADLVGFGDDGVYVAYNDGNGGFMPVRGVVDNQLCFSQGWGAEHPRFAARITEKRRADLVGFGHDGVWAAYHNDDGTFTPAFVLKDAFAYSQGWRVNRHPRFVADLTGNGLADLVGFFDDDIWISLNVDGIFQPAQRAGVNNLCYNQGWRIWHDRYLVDVTGNGVPDLVGFGDDGVWVALNNGDGSFGPARFVLFDFGDLSGTAGIEHIFVLIMENRSFDHMLGFSAISGTDVETGGLTTIDGLTGSECNTIDGSLCSAATGAQQFTVQPGADDRMPKDPGHSFNNTLAQLAGPDAAAHWMPFQQYPTPNNSGFVTEWSDPGIDPAEIMRCFSQDQSNVEVLLALAEEFVVCDAWFSSLPGPTFPNRMFSHAASSGGLTDQPGTSDIAMNEIYPGSGYTFPNGTIFDALRRTGHDFALYGLREPPGPGGANGHTFPMVASLSGISLNSVRDLQFDDQVPYPGYNTLVNDLGGGNFTATYVHIEPNYGFLDRFKYGTSQHPLGSVQVGDNFIKMIYEAIRNSPIWESSLLIIVWDEHGGFYDHVPPPKAVPPGDNVADLNGFRFDRLGVRVPAIIISPRIPKNLIDHRTYDHSSIPATIERLLNLDPLTDRDRAANSATQLLTLTQPRTDCPKTVGPRFGIEPSPRMTATSPPDPAAPITENDAAPLLAILLAQDLQASPPQEHAAIFRRVSEMKTHADVWTYRKEVERKLAIRRGSPVTNETLKKPRRAKTRRKHSRSHPEHDS